MTCKSLITSIGPPVLAGLCLGGCASPPDRPAWPEPRPLGAHYTTAGRPAPETDPETRQPPPGEPADALHLDQALALVLLNNPELEAFSYSVRAAEARALQANRPRNPGLDLELEEFDRNGAGLDSAEAGIVFSQAFQLGRKRHWRTEMATAEGELAGWTYESKRLDAFTAAGRRFLNVIAAQRQVELMEASVEIAEKTSRAVAARVAAGKEPPMQEAKATAEVEMARIVALEAANALDLARRQLAALWASENPLFQLAAGDFDAVRDTLPALSELRPLLLRNPDLARWDAEQRLRAARVSMAKAAAIPDVTGSVGLHRYEEDGSDALSFGLMFPLPLLDRNKDEVEANRQDEAGNRLNRAALELELATQLAERHAALVVAHRRVNALRDSVVPAMAAAFDAAHEGYAQGKFAYLDMLDAQRSLFEVRVALVRALNHYHAAVADIQRLIATNLEDVTLTTKED